MKTNAFARRLVKTRFVLCGLAIVVLVVMNVGLFESLACRLGQTMPSRAEAVQVPSLSIADLLAVAP